MSRPRRLALLFAGPMLAAFCGSLVFGGYTAEGTSISRPATVQADVRDALTQQAKVRVLVTLREPAELQAPQIDVLDLSVQVATMQADLLDTLLPTDSTLIYRYNAVPALAVEIGTEGLTALLEHPDVADVALDGQGTAALAQSVSIIRADAVHSSGVTGAGVVVAVLDSGIDTDHPDLAGDIAFEACYLSGGGCPGGAHAAEDDNGHGTNVAGIITSTGAVAPIGVAPDARIAAYKILNSSSFGFFSDWIAALDDIIANHPEVDIINMSLQSSSTFGCSTGAMATAITTLRSMGVLTFIAAGNHGTKNSLTIPACITEGISVGATYDANIGTVSGWKTSCTDFTTSLDQIACWSDSHSSLDLVAPGAAITSTGIGGGTATYFGTSQASPHAAGAAALLLDYDASLTPDQLEACLETGGVAITDSANGRTTPRVDASASLDCATPIPSNTPTVPPPVGGVSLDSDLRPLPLETSQPSSPPWVAVGVVAVAGPLALGGAAWYARRQRTSGETAIR